MTPINRRKALTAIASVPAAALAGSALASAGEDAELLRLWEEWKAQSARFLSAMHAQSVAEEAAAKDTAPRWAWAGGMGFFITPEATYSTTFRHFENGKPIFETVPLVGAKDYEDASDMAKAKAAEFDAEWQRSKKAAERKHKVAAAERAEDMEWAKVKKIAAQIIAAPAQGLKGLAVKLALLQTERDFLQEPADKIARSAYRSVVNLTGGVDRRRSSGGEAFLASRPHLVRQSAARSR